MISTALEAKRDQLLAEARKRVSALYTDVQILEIKRFLGVKGLPDRAAINPTTIPPMIQPALAETNGSLHVLEGSNGHEDHRSYWEAKEMKAVADKTAENLMKMGIGSLPSADDRSGGSIVMDCVRDAQAVVLQKHRRRPLGGRSALKEHFWKMVELEFTEIRARKAAALAPPPAPTVATNGHHEEARSVHLPILPTPKPAASPFDEAIDARIKAHLQPLEKFFLDEVVRLETELKQFKAELANQSGGIGYQAPAKPKLPRVGIFGALPEQFKFVEEGAVTAQLPIELVYFPKDEAQPAMNKIEWAVQFKFLRHQTTEQLQAAGIPGHQIAFVAGGVTSVIRQLEAWFKNE